jgi:hypothetical protein
MVRFCPGYRFFQFATVAVSWPYTVLPIPPSAVPCLFPLAAKLAAINLFLNPLIDFRGCNVTSCGLVRTQRTGCDRHSFRKRRLRKLLGLALRRE